MSSMTKILRFTVAYCHPVLILSLHLITIDRIDETAVCFFLSEGEANRSKFSSSAWHTRDWSVRDRLECFIIY
jgi:hypothetical protein